MAEAHPGRHVLAESKGSLFPSEGEQNTIQCMAGMSAIDVLDQVLETKSRMVEEGRKKLAEARARNVSPAELRGMEESLARIERDLAEEKAKNDAKMRGLRGIAAARSQRKRTNVAMRGAAETVGDYVDVYFGAAHPGVSQLLRKGEDYGVPGSRGRYYVRLPLPSFAPVGHLAAIEHALLGKGTQGVVIRAHDTQNADGIVVLKILRPTKDGEQIDTKITDLNEDLAKEMAKPETAATAATIARTREQVAHLTRLRVEHKDRLLAEFEKLSQVGFNHYVLPLLGSEEFYFADKGNPLPQWCLVFPYMAQGDLSKLIKKRYSEGEPLGSSEFLGYAKGIAKGVAVLHHAPARRREDGAPAVEPIVHGDIKPQNVFLGAEPNNSKEFKVWLGDLGSARDRTVSACNFSFSPANFPPEVCLAWRNAMAAAPAQGQKLGFSEMPDVPPDVRHDVFGLGTVYYELATGRPAFELCASFTDLLQRDTSLPQAPSCLNSKIHPAVDAVILKCLEPDPQKRFQTVAEVVEALDDARACLPRTATRSETAGACAPGERPGRVDAFLHHASRALMALVGKR